MAPARPSVALDTMALIWGIRKKGKQEYLDRAKWLFDKLNHENARIIIPSVVVAEYLTHVPEHLRGGIVSAFSTEFFVPPFDAKCAALACKLWELGVKARERGKPGSRACLRADTMIVATARVHGAHQLYSHDEDCRKLAEKANLSAFDLPAASEFLIDPDLGPEG